MQNIADFAGIKVKGHINDELRYADDIALIANSRENRLLLLNIVITERESRAHAQHEES